MMTSVSPIVLWPNRDLLKNNFSKFLFLFISQLAMRPLTADINWGGLEREGSEDRRFMEQSGDLII